MSERVTALSCIFFILVAKYLVRLEDGVSHQERRGVEAVDEIAADVGKMAIKVTKGRPRQGADEGLLLDPPGQDEQGAVGHDQIQEGRGQLRGSGRVEIEPSGVGDLGHELGDVDAAELGDVGQGLVGYEEVLPDLLPSLRYLLGLLRVRDEGLQGRLGLRGGQGLGQGDEGLLLEEGEVGVGIVEIAFKVINADE